MRRRSGGKDIADHILRPKWRWAGHDVMVPDNRKESWSGDQEGPSEVGEGSVQDGLTKLNEYRQTG